MTEFLTIAEYKALNGIVGTQQNAQIQDIINAVNMFIETYTDRKFFLNDVTTSLSFSVTPPKSTDPIFLPTFEVGNIVSLVDNINLLTLVEGTDYYYEDEDATLRLLTASWPIGRNSLTLTAYLGFSSIPEDLKLAASELTTSYLKREGARRTSAQTTPLTYEPIQGNIMPNHVRIILDQYRIRS